MPVNRYYSSTAVDTTLTGAVNSSATSITVASTSGFPASYPYTLALDFDTSSEELVNVTAAAGLTLTITRGQDGTTGTSHNAGAAVKHVISGRDLREPQEHIAASAGIHGVTGSVVGTTDTQTLTNKTLTSPTINGGTFSGALSGATGTLTGPTINGGSYNININSQTGTAYTLVAGDNGKVVTLDNASDVTFTVPTNTSVSLPTGAMISIMQKGTGILSVTGASGVAISTSNGYRMRDRYSLATVLKLDTDSWVLIGDIRI